MKKKKLYSEPSCRVYDLPEHPRLLQNSTRGSVKPMEVDDLGDVGTGGITPMEIEDI